MEWRAAGWRRANLKKGDEELRATRNLDRTWTVLKKRGNNVDFEAGLAYMFAKTRERLWYERERVERVQGGSAAGCRSSSEDDKPLSKKGRVGRSVILTEQEGRW